MINWSSITNLKDYFSAAQICKTPKEVSQQKQLKMSQRNLILRLTTRKDPVENMGEEGQMEIKTKFCKETNLFIDNPYQKPN